MKLIVLVVFCAIAYVSAQAELEPEDYVSIISIELILKFLCKTQHFKFNDENSGTIGKRIKKKKRFFNLKFGKE